MSSPLNARFVFTHPIHFLSCGFGSGLSPNAPGTMGTLAAFPLYLLLAPLPLSEYILMTLLVSVFGIYCCGKTSAALGVHDHPGIVWDEIAGLLITFIAAPPVWFWLAIGFGFFRFFDIVKPWPIGWIDKRVQGGLGIMLDDVIAAIYAGLLLQLSFFCFG